MSRQYFLDKLQKIKDKHFLGLIIAGFFLVVFWAISLPGSVSAPSEVKIGSVDDSSMAVSWITTKPTRGGLVLTTQPNRISRSLQFFVCRYFSLGCNFVSDEMTGPSTTHLVSLKDLVSEKPYYYRIYGNGVFFKRDQTGTLLPAIKTAPVLSGLSLPQPLYSYVYNENQKSVSGALVYLNLIDGQNRNILKSQPLITFTDQKGLWLVDLGNLRSFSLNEAVQPAATDLLFVKVWLPDGRTSAEYIELSSGKEIKPLIVR